MSAFSFFAGATRTRLNLAKVCLDAVGVVFAERGAVTFGAGEVVRAGAAIGTTTFAFTFQVTLLFITFKVFLTGNAVATTFVTGSLVTGVAAFAIFVIGAGVFGKGDTSEVFAKMTADTLQVGEASNVAKTHGATGEVVGAGGGLTRLTGLGLPTFGQCTVGLEHIGSCIGLIDGYFDAIGRINNHFHIVRR